MNVLGLMLLGSIVHATGFAVLGILVYLALRRRGPAAGSLVSGSTLTIMVLVSMVVLSPWPRWWTVAPESFVTTAAGASKAAEPTETLPTVPDGSEPLTRLSADASIDPHAEAPQDEIGARPSLLTFLLEELRRPAMDRASARWGWVEWIAVGFFASLTLGLIRLGLGLWGMTRLRARSVPIDDRDLHDAIEILRAEMSCKRSVEVRELAELATPATIGWRRPLLFLPGDWRDWSPDERRAVLAHELAHVRRGDFLAGLVAQAGLALHFYHPLAHWLANRLRLEQELAADAWGARLSGGKPSYLATLAQMALRRDSRAMSWPARAFLPSHGTFVRRIEMLRNSKHISPGSLPMVARVVTVGVLAAMGLLIAGLRGPAGESLVLAQAQPVAQPQGGGAQDDVNAYNLAFLPADTKMVLAIRPGPLLRNREFRSLLDRLFPDARSRNAMVVPPEDIEQFLLFWEGEPTGVGPGPVGLMPMPSGCVLRMSKPQDWKAVLTQLHGPSQEVRHAGQTILLSANPPLPGAFFAPDDRTLVQTRQETLLHELIEDRNAPAPRRAWDEAWKRVAKGQVMLALETRWIRRRIAESQQVGPGPRGPRADALLKLETFSPLWQNARSYALGINAADKGLAVDLVAGTGSDPDARSVTETIQAMVTLAKNALKGLRQDLRQPVAGGEGMEWLLQSAGTLLEKARVETSEGFVHLGATSDVDLAEGIKLLAPAVTTARAAARRAQSVNNLKQIGLAFHNYHSTYGRFPAAVNLGGKSGKVPYSWRIAILPYLEQQDLYNAYNFDEPWDGPNNRKLIAKMPAVYAYPGTEGTVPNPGHTAYFVFAGPSTALSVGPPRAGAAGGGAAIGAAGEPPRTEVGGPGHRFPTPAPVEPNAAVPEGPSIQQFTDGTSNTILTVEARRDIPWTKPEDIPFNPKAPLPELGGFTPDGFNAGFADGSVHYIKKSIKTHVLIALITRDYGEIVSSDSY
jgi:beta-lactamase regulating signal transducer with metallopeptidase domain